MEGLGSLLLFAALFYFMMRFGCGAHMVHGHGRGGRDVKMYGGRDYRLCSRACLDKFEEHPDQYASVAGGAR